MEQQAATAEQYREALQDTLTKYGDRLPPEFKVRAAQALAALEPPPDRTGQTFGNWRVLGPAKAPKGRKCTYWLCRCTCGRERPVRERGLLNGNSTNCGSCPTPPPQPAKVAAPRPPTDEQIRDAVIEELRQAGTSISGQWLIRADGTKSRSSTLKSGIARSCGTVLARADAATKCRVDRIFKKVIAGMSQAGAVEAA